MAEERIYEWPEHYDLEHAQEEPDIGFYVGLAVRLKPRRLLELGCGTGRITIPIAKAAGGFCDRIVGLDNASPMLESAREKGGREEAVKKCVSWQQGDLRTWRDREPFQLVIAPCGTLSHLLSIQDQLQALTNVRTNLAPGGRFAADVQMAELGILAESLHGPPRAILQIDNDTQETNRDADKRLIRYKAVDYNVAEQRAWVRFLYDEFVNGKSAEGSRRLISDYESHVYYPRELQLLFKMAGFTIESLWGDYYRGPLRNRSDAMVIIARNQA